MFSLATGYTWSGPDEVIWCFFLLTIGITIGDPDEVVPISGSWRACDSQRAYDDERCPSPDNLVSTTSSLGACDDKGGLIVLEFLLQWLTWIGLPHTAYDGIILPNPRWNLSKGFLPHPDLDLWSNLLLFTTTCSQKNRW